MNDIEKAIEYLEDAIRETDETITDCSPALQAELTEQKAHFVIAIAAMREKQERTNPKLLTMEQLKKRLGKPIWFIGKGSNGWWRILSDQDHLAQYFHDGSFVISEQYGITWWAYDYPPVDKEASNENH